jgi:hypothetical protein
MRWLVRLGVLACVAGCLSQAATAIDPPAEGGGTLTCREIVEQCDATCGDPLCVRRCGDQGTPEAARLHDAVVDCAQRNGCADEACIRASCGPEADACRGPDPVEPVGP